MPPPHPPAPLCARRKLTPSPRRPRSLAHAVAAAAHGACRPLEGWRYLACGMLTVGPNEAKRGSIFALSKLRLRITCSSAGTSILEASNGGGMYGAAISRCSSAPHLSDLNQACIWMPRKPSGPLPSRPDSSPISKPETRSPHSSDTAESERRSFSLVSSPPLWYLVICAKISVVLPSNGVRPVIISCSNTPRPHQSAAAVRPLPSSSSGGTYSSVPHAVNVRSSTFFAKPMSARHTYPPLSRSTFSGFMSLYT
mmetsp:Transcript_69812/g.191565  ORF Transcript_69812/g.191565 Transcript_69812/m.191565 type:complete len:254 (+) Transcript_69812:166-927(+)